MLRENVIVENDCLEQAVWCGYVLPRLAGGLGEDLGSENFGQVGSGGDLSTQEDKQLVEA
jgi:hypothetical protein